MAYSQGCQLASRQSRNLQEPLGQEDPLQEEQGDPPLEEQVDHLLAQQEQHPSMKKNLSQEKAPWTYIYIYIYIFDSRYSMGLSGPNVGVAISSCRPNNGSLLSSVLSI